MRDDELELCAIEEQFAAEVRAGKRPRIAGYLTRYPTHATALADFAAALLAGEVGDMDDMDDMGETSTKEVAAQARRAAPSAGTLRALDVLFGDEAPAGMDADIGERPLDKVAERRARYRSSAQGLAGLAQTRGITMDALAEAVDLPAEALAQLDAGEVEVHDGAPAALLARLGAALGVGPSRVAETLAGRESHQARTHPAGLSPVVGTAATFRELITTHPAVSTEQRARWLALLAAGSIETEHDG